MKSPFTISSGVKGPGGMTGSAFSTDTGTGHAGEPGGMMGGNFATGDEQGGPGGLNGGQLNFALTL